MTPKLVQDFSRCARKILSAPNSEQNSPKPAAPARLLFLCPEPRDASIAWYPFRFQDFYRFAQKILSAPNSEQNSHKPAAPSAAAFFMPRPTLMQASRGTHFDFRIFLAALERSFLLRIPNKTATSLPRRARLLFLCPDPLRCKHRVVLGIKKACNFRCRL